MRSLQEQDWAIPSDRPADKPAAAVTTRMPTDALALADDRLARFAARTALCIPEGGGWRELTYAELSRRARALAATLIQSGVRQGDRVAILSESKPEWGVAFFAALRSGATAVPLDPKLTETELVTILSDCAPRAVLASEANAILAEGLRQRVASIAKILVLEEAAAGATQPPMTQVEREPKSLLRRPEPDATALIIYTSGTTGSPKGVMISFGNLIFETLSLERVIELGPGDTLLSILPLHHLLELTGGFLGVLNRGGTICYSRSLFPQDIARLLRERRIKTMIGVPLFFRSLMNSLESEIRRAGLPGRLGFRAAWILSRLFQWRRARRFLFRPLHQALGGRLEFFVSGGAPLESHVAHFFDRIGLPILEGYGLTEASPVVALNTLAARRIGSVGRPLSGVEVRIDPPAGGIGMTPPASDGEILTRGPHVMKGYFGRDDLTREVVDADGWLHTGDLGRVEPGGFLYVTGRLRNLIVLGSGKKVFPEDVEAVLERSPHLREVCVLGWPPRRPGAGGEEVCVVVSAARGPATPKDIPGATDRWFEEEVARMARDLAPHKRPTRVIVRREELPRTPSRKLKRSLIRDWVREQDRVRELEDEAGPDQKGK